MDLRGVAADRRHCDGVLEQAPGVVVVDVRARRELADAAPEHLVGEKAPDERLQAEMPELATEELEKAVELVGVAPESRGKSRGVLALGRFERTHVELKAVSILVDSPEHAYGIALAEAAVE